MADPQPTPAQAEVPAQPAAGKKPAAKKEGNAQPKADKKKKAGHVDPKSQPGAEFWEKRIARFEELWSKQEAEYEAKSQDITITLLDGNTKPAKSWKTTPEDVARSLSSQLPDKMFCALVNDEQWDMGRVLEGDCRLEFLDWEDERSQHIFWHSSAHILGCGMEWLYGAKLSSGPPLPEGGFFYEADTKEPVSETQYEALQALVKDVTAKKHPFQRLVISKEDALDLFGYNHFKYQTLKDKVPENGTCTVYRCGPLIDPCRGPHLPHTGRVKAFKVTKNSSSYWRNKDTNPVLQRVYGIAFPKEAMLKEWNEVMKAAAENDHRRVGTKQELWMFHDYSPGSAFWHPAGTHVYNTLTAWMRKMYRKKGFDEVISPNMYNKDLWMTSGHWQKYQDDMFQIKQDSAHTYALKPMNCPGHCLMFAHTRRSFKEFPVRFADFGVLHRNELQGALSGLTRVRRFCQDDAHIFCLPEQTETEIEAGLRFLEEVYEVLGFKFHLALSTRPKTMLGTHAMWDRSEGYLRNALNKFCKINSELDDPFTAGKKFSFDGTPDAVRRLKAIMQKADKDGVSHGIKHTWAINEGDGAFYGPKIDIRIEDCMKRKHQLGTLQLDFNLPQRFDLTYEPPTTLTIPPLPEGAQVMKTGDIFNPSPEDPTVDELGNKAADCLTGNAALKAYENNFKRPVMIHRAILGSLERCIAILTEHWKGKWPFWVSPRQIVIIPVSADFNDYARRVKDELYGEGFQAVLDLSANTLNKKVRNGQVAQFNFILVVGEKEQETESVNVRTRDMQQHGTKTLVEVQRWFRELSDTQTAEF
eukprot:TRINITY_DN2980_c0_g1_i1.p1 TRINITY_DN2980_c0_g1~~TRINITY_DN2980_c0_g1_i1.p1  ORF type:complete len:812 (+),score=393.26 TRINITY_DN2980_c0_g1_i1:157-2592(+)